MNFDDRFLGLMNMIGGLSNNTASSNASNNSKQGMNFEGIMRIMGLMQGLQGVGGQGGNLGQNQSTNGGLDIMKMLPLLTALKGGNPFAMANNNFQPQPQGSFDNNAETSNPSTTGQREELNEKHGGYKDKYSAISFAGNEVIYSLGKLWKTYKAP